MTAPYIDSGAAPTTKKQRLERMRMQLENERASFIAQWRECHDFILPHSARFTAAEHNRGDRRNQKIIDSTATDATEILVAGFMSHFTNPSNVWCRLTTSDPRQAEPGDVKEWLHFVTHEMHGWFLRSNLYDKLPLTYEDMAVFGTGAMIIEEDAETVINCHDLPIGTYLIGTDARGRVAVLIREMRFTIRQLVEKFGGDGPTPDWTQFSTHVRREWDAHHRDTLSVDVCHAIYPNDDYRERSLLPRYKRFASCYWEKGTSQDGPEQGKFLEESGFDEWPAPAARWTARGTDAWGTRCPGMKALGTIKQIQAMEKRGMQGYERSINPPLVAPTALRNAVVNVLPGGTTWVDDVSGKQFRPLYMVDPRLEPLEAKLEQLRRQVKRAFHADAFLTLSDGPAADRREITAAEIHARQDEKLLVIGPTAGRIDRELLAVLVDRWFGIAVRQGRIPPAPEALQGQSLRIEYLSTMAQAQKAVSLGSMDRVLDFATRQVLASGGNDMSVLDKYDMDQMADEYNDGAGGPPGIIRPDEQVAELRQSRQRMQEMQQEAEIAAKLGPGAKALSEAKTGGDNMLTAIAGGLSDAA